MNLVVINRLKKLISDNYNFSLHFHDICGSGSSKSIDENNPKVFEEIVKFCEMEKLKYTVSKDKKSFYIE